jgi:hypothetical protein
MSGVPLADAARELGVPPGTMRRWIRRGCPVAARGRRGRGHALLLDPDAVRAWRESSSADAVVLEIASAVPHLLADAAAESFQLVNGMDKRVAAAILTGGWYVAAHKVLDYLRKLNVAVPDLAAIPEQIERLRKIAQK